MLNHHFCHFALLYAICVLLRILVFRFAPVKSYKFNYFHYSHSGPGAPFAIKVTIKKNNNLALVHPIPFPYFSKLVQTYMLLIRRRYISNKKMKILVFFFFLLFSETQIIVNCIFFARTV